MNRYTVRRGAVVAAPGRGTHPSTVPLLHQVHQTHQTHDGVHIALAVDFHATVGEPFLVFRSQTLVQFLEGGEFLVAPFFDFSRLVVNDLVIDLLTDGFGQFVNRLDENTLVSEPFPGAVDVGAFGIGDVVVPPRVVGGVAETVAGVGGMATESDFLAVDGGSKILNVAVLDHFRGFWLTIQR